jgi:hypothetical protein
MANGILAASQIEMLSQSGTGIVTITPPATNTNRALTLPDAAGEVVTNSATQTLTNKTIQGGALTRATAVTASGTSVDFTSIPSWVKRITVMFSLVSTNGTSGLLVQIGDSGGIETTAYQSGLGSIFTTSAATASSTAGYLIGGASAANQAIGHYIFTNITGNTWVGSGVIYLSNSQVHYVAGSKTLSDTLDRVRITTVNGTDTFDAGTINIMYEG